MSSPKRIKLHHQFDAMPTLVSFADEGKRITSQINAMGWEPYQYFMGCATGGSIIAANAATRWPYRVMCSLVG